MVSFGGQQGGDWSRAPREPSGFGRYLATIRRHIGLIVTCTALTLAAALAYVAIAPRTYTAQAELLVNPASQTNTVLFSLPVLHATGDPTRDVLTAASLVTTSQVAQGVIQGLHLKTTPSDLLQKVQANPLAQSNIVAVQATAPSATRAQQLANGFAGVTIAVRTAVLHQALAQLIPQLQAKVAALPPAERNGAGSLGDELSQLEELQGGNDPTLVLQAPAELPTGPTSPRTKLSLAAGLFAGLLIGIAAAFAFDALDPRVQREQQVRELFGDVPVLARVPRVGKGRDPRPLVPAQLSVTAIEQYRTLRAKLATRALGSQTYLLTGSGRWEGKSTSAIGLAAALAHAGDSVILIEADLRRPSIAAALELGTYHGTEQVLVGETPLSEALTPVQLDGALLRVLAAHSHSAGVADRLSLSAARRLVQGAKELADFVVIDAPPLTEVIDALPLAQIADEVVIIVRVGQTRLGKLSELSELLRQQGTSPSGLALIGVREAGGYSYYLEPPVGADDYPPAAAADELGLPHRAERPGHARDQQEPEPPQRQHRPGRVSVRSRVSGK